jgi:peptide/nickel transport system substrate-binding protein
MIAAGIAGCGGPAATAVPVATAVPAATAIPAGAAAVAQREAATTVPADASAAEKGGTLIIAMTASDVPIADAQPNQGFEGFRFVGYQLGDGLTRWDLGQDKEPAGVMPGLATSWEVDPNDPQRWTFHLREDVKFHDGTDWNADAAIWGLNRAKQCASCPEKAAYYNPNQARQIGFRIAAIDDWDKKDDLTIGLHTNVVTSFVPWNVLYFLFPSPTRVEQEGQDDYGLNPAGTGPWKFVKLTPREKLELERWDGYWGTKTAADKLVLLPVPEATSRLASLRAGQVSWIEVPPPDAIPDLRDDGFQVKLNPYPHTWPYQLYLERPPFNNKNIRIAANYAVDREGLCNDLLNGTCIPMISQVYPGHPWYGDPPRKFNYDPEKSCQMVKAEGLDRIKFTVLTSTSGSGQMLPVPMNEFLQRTMKAACFDMEIIAVDWGTFGAYQREHKWDTYEARNGSTGTVDPYSAFVRLFHTRSFPPVAINRGRYSNPEMDRLIEEAEQEFDPAELDKILTKINEFANEEAIWLNIVHDLNPRVLAPNVKDMIHAQSWFVDLQAPWVDE